MTKWQKSMVQDFEGLSGFELMQKDMITNDTFWDIWDRNTQWLRDMVEEVVRLENANSQHRY